MNKKTELTENDIKDFKLNIAEMEEQIDELNTSIKVLYLWANRMGLEVKKKHRIFKSNDFNK